MDKTITAELLHPEIQGPPLERGIRYGHHFVVELISDGRRLWAVASEEGQKLLHEIAHGIGIDGPEPVQNQSGIGTEVVTDPSNPGNGPATVNPNFSAGLDPDGNPATGGAPQPINLPPQAGAAAPTTTTAPGNTFDS